MYVELNPGPLQEQQVFLTAGSFLQPIPYFLRQSLTDCNVNLDRPAGWLVSSRDPPVSSPTPPATQHEVAEISIFYGMLGIQTQVLLLSRRTVYLQSHHPVPEVKI